MSAFFSLDSNSRSWAAWRPDTRKSRKYTSRPPGSARGTLLLKTMIFLRNMDVALMETAFLYCSAPPTKSTAISVSLTMYSACFAVLVA